MSVEHRDHLFISYATEDVLLADWLTRRLTAEGYRVWCDRVKLLGGESYPRDIDDAIKNRTFRLLALLSHASLKKPNPLKERTLALNIGRRRNIDFLIPLNVDGLSGDELDWMTSDLTFIPFDRSWVDGLNRLLKKLESLNTPRPLANGRVIATPSFYATEFLADTCENLYTNCFKFTKIPVAISRFRSSRSFDVSDVEEWTRKWAFWKVDARTFLAFASPPPKLTGDPEFQGVGGASWADVDKIDGIPTHNIAASLLKKSLLVKCLQKELRYSDATKLTYFPRGLLKGNWLRFVDYRGRKNRVLVTGERKKRWRYHLAPVFVIRWDLAKEPLAVLNIRIHIAEMDGTPSSHKTALRRRKSLCKSWFNHDWLNRVLAVGQFFADGTDRIAIGTTANEQIVLSAAPETCVAPVGLDEEALNEERSQYWQSGTPGDEVIVEEEDVE